MTKKTTRNESQIPSRPSPQGKSQTGEEEILGRLQPNLRNEMKDLLRQEKKIVAALQRGDHAKLFLTNPGEALNRMGIKVPPQLRNRLKQTSQPDFTLKRTFRLPNGQEITPNVRIRFVTKKRG